jgi:hypothetical protein
LLFWLKQYDETDILLDETTAGTHAAPLRLPDSLRSVPAHCFDRIFLRNTIALDSRGLRFIDVARDTAIAPELRRLLAETAATIRRQRAEARELLAQDLYGSLEKGGRKGEPSCASFSLRSSRFFERGSSAG